MAKEKPSSSDPLATWYRGLKLRYRVLVAFMYSVPFIFISTFSLMYPYLLLHWIWADPNKVDIGFVYWFFFCVTCSTVLITIFFHKLLNRKPSHPDALNEKSTAPDAPQSTISPSSDSVVELPGDATESP